jgi:hypothetical protein
VKHARNIAIILLIGLGVDVIPGGGQGATSFQQLLYLLFLGTIAWFVSILYREHRATLYSLGDRRRAILYASIGALILVVSALWRVSGPSAVVALVVAGVAVYAIVAIFVSARQY